MGSTGEWQTAKAKDELQTINRRLNELDRLIGSLYENFISGLLPEKQYKSLMKKYSAEQDNLESQVSEIQEKLEQTKASSAHSGDFSFSGSNQEVIKFRE